MIRAGDCYVTRVKIGSYGNNNGSTLDVKVTALHLAKAHSSNPGGNLWRVRLPDGYWVAMTGSQELLAMEMSLRPCAV
jgi:hypothetical protein